MNLFIFLLLDIGSYKSHLNRNKCIGSHYIISKLFELKRKLLLKSFGDRSLNFLNSNLLFDQLNEQVLLKYRLSNYFIVIHSIDPHLYTNSCIGSSSNI